MSTRLQKFLAEAGVASRRAARKSFWPGGSASTASRCGSSEPKLIRWHDEVTVDGKPVRAKRKIYVALHKPVGCVCSNRDELGRPAIQDLLPKEWQNLHSVGRLDFNSEGLIFLTNDGQFALHLTHPRYGVRKKYVATIEGRVEKAMLPRSLRTACGTGAKSFQAQAARLVSAGHGRERGGIGTGGGQKPRSAAVI